MWRALENNLPEIKEEVEVLRPCDDRKVQFFTDLLHRIIHRSF